MNRQCKKLLDEQLEADAAFLNFCLDALVVSIIGTRSRDFQLDLCDETVAIVDQDLLVCVACVRHCVCDLWMFVRTYHLSL